MKFLRFPWALRALLLLGLGFPPIHADVRSPVRIVPIGDSITQGRAGGSGKPPTYSWRYPLWKFFAEADIPVDFVGSTNSGFQGNPNWAPHLGRTFDLQHEGHWGWSSKQVADQLPFWLQSYTPDLAIVFLGTNDQNDFSGKPTASTIVAHTIAQHRRILEALRTANPQVILLLGGPSQNWDRFPEVRRQLELLAEEENTPDSPVLYVDQSPGWISDPSLPQSDTVDWVHPNEKGDTVLATRWLAALREVLPQSYGVYRTGFPGWQSDPRSLPESDYDGDGHANFYEYACGGDPRQPGTPPTEIFPRPEAREYVYRQPWLARATDVRWIIETSHGLGADWTTLYDSESAQPSQPTGPWMELSGPLPASAPIFFRTRVVRRQLTWP